MRRGDFVDNYREFKEFFEEISALPADDFRERVYTMPYIFGKEYKENFISDWLAFVLNPQINGIGAEPVKALLRIAGYDDIPADELFFNMGGEGSGRLCREYPLGENGRIDFLINVYSSAGDAENVLFRVAIENKIGAWEGAGQTEKYYSYIEGMKRAEDSIYENVYIFLTPNGTSPVCKGFKPVSYGDFIPELKKIPIDFTSDFRKAFLVNEFILHMEGIMESNKLNDADFVLIKYAETLKKAEERYDRLLEIFYNELGGMEFLSSDDWKTNYPNGKRYWQCYKEGWNNIHYEIVPVAESSKYYLSADGEFRVELHVEGRNRRDIMSRLKTPAKAEIDGAIRRDTENDRRAVVSFEFKEDFSSREKMNDSIKKIKAAFEWLDRTYTSQIDAITRRDSNE